jgi:dTDP-4-dehydrorhamnose reductase
MRILVFGSNGQVGLELQRALAPLGVVQCISRESDPNIDFAKTGALAELVNSVRPTVIVNAAAYTAVDGAEDEPEAARRVNALAPAELARAAKACGSLLVHYSTDYVYDGTGTHYREETAPTGPLSVYGNTKLEGELLIAQSGCEHLIFRTSWVYGIRGKNFLRTILNLAKSRDSLRVVSDQTGAPTGADLIADATSHAIMATIRNPELRGTYHLTSAGETSWYGLAVFAIAAARKLGLELKAANIEPISTGEFPQKALRPKNSRMSTAKIRRNFGLALPDWQDGVIRVIGAWTSGL